MTTSDPKPVPPREPLPEDCCGGGCANCVYIRFGVALERYREALLAFLTGCFETLVCLAPFRGDACALLRTVIARGYDLSLGRAVEQAYVGFEGVKLDLSLQELLPKLADFFRERLRGLLAADLPADVVEACLATDADRPNDVQARARALAQLDAEVRARAGEVFKRATNIAKALRHHALDAHRPLHLLKID